MTVPDDPGIRPNQQDESAVVNQVLGEDGGSTEHQVRSADEVEAGGLEVGERQENPAETVVHDEPSAPIPDPQPAPGQTPDDPVAVPGRIEQQPVAAPGDDNGVGEGENA